MRDAFIKGLSALAEADERIVLLTGDLGFKIFDDFARRCMSAGNSGLGRGGGGQTSSFMPSTQSASNSMPAASSGPITSTFGVPTVFG